MGALLSTGIPSPKPILVGEEDEEDEEDGEGRESEEGHEDVVLGGENPIADKKPSAIVVSFTRKA